MKILKASSARDIAHAANLKEPQVLQLKAVLRDILKAAEQGQYTIRLDNAGKDIRASLDKLGFHLEASGYGIIIDWS